MFQNTIFTRYFLYRIIFTGNVIPGILSKELLEHEHILYRYTRRPLWDSMNKISRLWQYQTTLDHEENPKPRARLIVAFQSVYLVTIVIVRHFSKTTAACVNPSLIGSRSMHSGNFFHSDVTSSVSSCKDRLPVFIKPLTFHGQTFT